MESLLQYDSTYGWIANSEGTTTATISGSMSFSFTNYINVWTDTDNGDALVSTHMVEMVLTHSAASSDQWLAVGFATSATLNMVGSTAYVGCHGCQMGGCSVVSYTLADKVSWPTFTTCWDQPARSVSRASHTLVDGTATLTFALPLSVVNSTMHVIWAKGDTWGSAQSETRT